PHGRVAGVGALGRGIDAILHRRRAQDAELGGEVVGEALDEDGVTPQREMGSVLLTGADGHEEAGVALERGPHLVRNEGLQLQRRIAVDSAELKAALGQAVAEARRLAERGRTAALLPAEAQFAPLASAVAAGWLPTIERGVMVLGAGGEPRAWAGRHRFIPARDTAELRSAIPPFYVSLEARRQTRDGGMAVGTVLLHDAPAAAGGGGALNEAFARAHDVTLRFYAPSAAPADPNVFDYASPDGPTLFSVRPVPPLQGDAKVAALRRAAQRTGVTLGAVLFCLMIAAPAGRGRWVVV